MLAIILSVCMTSDPNVCRDYRLSVESDLDLAACTANAPPFVAQWTEEHPGWRIKRWHCTSGNEADL